MARVYGKNESSIREVMKNKETIHASSAVAPQTAKVIAIATARYSVNDGGKRLKFVDGKHDLYCSVIP